MDESQRLACLHASYGPTILVSSASNVILIPHRQGVRRRHIGLCRVDHVLRCAVNGITEGSPVVCNPEVG